MPSPQSSYSDSEDYLPETAGPVVKAGREVFSGFDSLPADRCLEIFRLMVRSRTLEERTIKMSKSGEGYFWVGGPGEEAFNVCLGLQVKKGRGPAYDYLHLHYRNAGVMIAMGMSMLEHMRQMAMTATDRHSLGRNFVGHYAAPEWNVIPVTSVIEVQYTMAPGTALMQKRHGGDGVSVVIGGDAGTAEGDFTSCMVWSTRPGSELPVLMVVTNNGYGISTPAVSQHSERHISDRGEPFGIPGERVDGNDPIATWHALERAFEHCRTTRRPYLMEAMVSRLHGHSSSSGAARVQGEADCVRLFERKLIQDGVIHRELAEMIWHDAQEEAAAAAVEATSEPMPTPDDVERFTYAPSKVDAVYPDDYSGLPR
ncbi:MAG TPA: thiamine pyrophosphate-dependent dehydrogenase E1 component subunit alpha [Gemmataceae bacterium]|nr:thiamine pyrophosphate-dependent dehydrogenase E1 component subunit alpha [Gemmataceae bacterium]